MKTMKLQSILGVSTCALLLASASAWGATERANAATPMPVIQEPQTQPAPSQAPSQPSQAPSQAQPDQGTPNQDSAKTSTFTGTIMKNGEQWVLRDSSGNVYKLDDSSRAQSFEGKTVKVTGRLDADSKTIHVDTIQALAS
jgi:uncharacterized protein YdeI (BOF family)